MRTTYIRNPEKTYDNGNIADYGHRESHELHALNSAVQKGDAMTEITFTEERDFTVEQVRKLFKSVGWVSANYPEQLHKALLGSSTVISAWDGDRLVGLVRALDDGAMLAYVHYVLVDPEYQGNGIAGHMIDMLTDKYRDFFYIEVMPEESKNATFYQKHGFKVMDDGVAMQIVNPDW